MVGTIFSAVEISQNGFRFGDLYCMSSYWVQPQLEDLSSPVFCGKSGAMKNDVEKFHRSIGKIVTSVAANVLFYRVETEGHLSSVSITFAGGNSFTMGCAGDGSIFIVQSPDRNGDAPGFITERRTVESIGGELRGVTVVQNGLRLAIGEQEVILVNQDDELLFLVDGKFLPAQVFMR